ncbi:MAG: hypothetical protein LBT86_05525 [Deltaproteobacteria bacterium]|jgi:hypothetical protein|nr:hypothetical protein [Deltaproteobacteria bacterium]
MKPQKKSWPKHLAQAIQTWLTARDSRLLVAALSLSGLVAWNLTWRYWPIVALFWGLALIPTLTAFQLYPQARGALLAYGLFVLFWIIAQFVLYAWDKPGQTLAAFYLASGLGIKLLTLLGLAMTMPLAATPITLGRASAWFLEKLATPWLWLKRLFPRGKKKADSGQTPFWRVSLALTLMMAFFPRALRTARELQLSLKRRAPFLPLPKKIKFLGLALLRVVSSQTWEITLAIVSRDLDRPEPWRWRAKN